MDKNRVLILTVAIGSAVLGGLATLLYQDATQESGEGKTLSRKTDTLQPPKPQWMDPAPGAASKETTGPEGTNPSRAAGKPPRPNLENPPLREHIRDEVAQNPHVTPQALLVFAEELSVSLQGAFADKETRYTVSRQLIECARDKQTRGSAQAARALCLYNLERLKDKFPDELSPSYQSLLAELPEDLIFVSGVANGSEEK